MIMLIIIYLLCILPLTLGENHCCPIKEVFDGNITMVYDFKEERLPGNPNCMDDCVYTKDGEDYCFSSEPTYPVECIEDPCYEPFAVAGPCDMVIPRWSYNQETGSCEEFTYGGCGGNNNNFQSFQECANSCQRPDFLPYCSQGPVYGPQCKYACSPGSICCWQPGDPGSTPCCQPGTQCAGPVPENFIAEVQHDYAQNHEESIRNLKTTNDIQAFLDQFKTCDFITGLSCAVDIGVAILNTCSTSLHPLQCVKRSIPPNCLSCISNVCRHIPLACNILPSLCCKQVERQRTNGSDCNRDCTKNDFKECVWNFTVRNQYSDAPGRLADGRNRSILTYNDELPGPSIVVCELDTVVINLKNEIQGTFEERQGQSNGTTLHMHGIRRWQHSYEDGVPGINQCEVKSNGTFKYTMIADDYHENAPPGTYWYHSHVGSQRTNGLYGKLIIKPIDKFLLNDTEVIDDADNTLVLQEWYKNDRRNVPMSILINGKGRIGKTMNAIPSNKVNQSDMHLDKYNKGKNVCFDQVNNTDYPNYNTNYSEFNVNYTLSYRFRIIGAISQNFPLCVSVEDHRFTAIATDSIHFIPVENVDVVCLAAGERYDIVIKTKAKNEVKETPYKIKVFGKSCESSPLCTVAWLKYPNQTVDYKYIVNSTCDGFNIDNSQTVLNPVMGADFKDTANDITLNELIAETPPNTITSSVDKNYVFFEFITMNGFEMTYPKTPFLFQSPANETNRCGRNCNLLQVDNYVCGDYPLPSQCKPGETCQCEHVVHQPHVPGYAGEFYWFETILINPYNEDMPAAHPIHQHGGWYRVLAVKQFDIKTINITKDYIMELDKSCNEGKNCLPRNYDYPIQKDTIQVPVNGYVIFRTPLDNAGTWIVHCHINHHVESGMAMVFQIGGLDEKIPFQEWSLGNFTKEVNKLSCPLNTYQNPASIDWFYGMKPILHACADPGHTIWFTWLKGHNVNVIAKEVWEKCDPFTHSQQILKHGDFNWTATTHGTFYFACGVGDGWHCKHGGLKAKVTVPCV